MNAISMEISHGEHDTMINVQKRDGSVEPLQLNKFHKMVEAACRDLEDVSESQIEINSGIEFYDGIKTSDIQQILVKSAANLITLDNPNYQYAAARLMLFGLYKQIYRQIEPIPLIDMVKQNIERKMYDPKFLEYYTEKEIGILNSFMDFKRDYLFTHAGISILVDKYLVQDRHTKEVYETPQYMYIMIAATLFAKYPRLTRMKYVKDFYDAISLFKLNLPTPIMSGVRTPIKQYSSCVLIEVDDTMKSIFSSVSAIGYFIAQRAGIGVNVGRIRSKGASVRKGDVVHSGAIPFIKLFQSAVTSCHQGGVRQGSATATVPIWHKDIEDYIVLKNSKGSEDNRARRLDYSIGISKIFYERFLNDNIISLFCPNEVPELYDNFGLPEFDDLYLAAENNPNISRKTISAVELFTSILRERAETGRIYIINMDHFNSHSSFEDHLRQSNLCLEISLPTKPLQHIDDAEGEIGVCILMAINAGNSDVSEHPHLADLSVRALDELIDLQKYPVLAAEISTRKRRSLGVGFIGIAHHLAKNNIKDEPWHEIHRLSEHLQFNLLKASNNLAKEKGPCTFFNRTKYAKGILPIDTYKKDIDSFLGTDLECDWESLRQSIKEHGLRNSTLSAQMPSESSSQVSNETNGIEYPRAFMTTKGGKNKPVRLIVPGWPELKDNYQLIWDLEDNDTVLKNSAAMQKFFDQAISTNTNYNTEHYENHDVPMSSLVEDLLKSYSWGLKTLYYHNTMDGNDDKDVGAQFKKTEPETYDDPGVRYNQGPYFPRIRTELEEMASTESNEEDSCASGACAI